MSSRRTIARLLLPALVALGVVGTATPAAAVGASATAAAVSVPGEVATYISTQLIDDLNEYYGPGTDGNGRLFTNTTTTTGGIRIFEFTPDFLAGVEAEPPVRRVNEWLSVISIDENPVGFATVTIDPLTVKPQLGTYTESADFGAVVAALPETASLVRDAGRSAWFALDGDELTPIVAGTSEVTTPSSVDAYRAIVAKQPLDEAPAADNNNSLIIVGLILALIVLLLALEAALPYWRRRAREKREFDEPVVEPVETPSPKSKPAPKPKPATEPAATPKPAAPPKPAATPKPAAKPKPAPKPELEVAAKEPAKPRAPRTKPTPST